MNIGGPDDTILQLKLKKEIIVKMEEYEEKIDRRRDKLRDLLLIEERQFIKETIDKAQTASDDVYEEMKMRTEKLRAKRELERLEIVKQKKLQQSVEKYWSDILPLINKRNLKESKEMQKLQMLENKAKKESERELDHMWYEMFMKQSKQIDERTEQDRLKHKIRTMEDIATWDRQVKDHELKKLDELREKREECMRLDNLREEIRREEIAKLDEKRRKRDEWYRILINQMNESKELERKRNAEELEYVNLMRYLQQQEIEKERPKDNKPRLKKELDQFMDYIARLDEERKFEEHRLNELIRMELADLQAKQDEARCNAQKAREALQKEAVLEWGKQIELKRKKMEEELILKETENKILRMAQEHNERLRAEYNRQKLLESRKYCSDLKKQIEYNLVAKEREKRDIEERLKRGVEQEKEYKRKLYELISDTANYTKVHPFRNIINNEKCPCPKPIY